MSMSMKNLALIICMVILSGCSIQGTYYLYDTTDPDIDIPLQLVLKDGKGIANGGLSNTNPWFLGTSFHYDIERLFEKYKVINIEYIDTTKFHLSPKGLVNGNVIVLSGADDPSIKYYFVKVDVPELKARSAKKMDRYNDILMEKWGTK